MAIAVAATGTLAGSMTVTVYWIFGGTPAPAILLTLIAYVVSAAGFAYDIQVGRNTIGLSTDPCIGVSLVTGIAPAGPLIVTVALLKLAPGYDSDQRFES